LSKVFNVFLLPKMVVCQSLSNKTLLNSLAKERLKVKQDFDDDKESQANWKII